MAWQQAAEVAPRGAARATRRYVRVSEMLKKEGSVRARVPRMLRYR